MGLMRFLVSHRDRITDDVLGRIYVSGLEEIPWRSRAYWDGEMLGIEREVSDSGNVHIPWRNDAGAEITLTTASLMERERPYQLEVELARGTINVIRNQIAMWRTAGLVVSEEINTVLAEANHHFSLAATSQQEPATAAEHARQSIEAAVRVVGELGLSYTEQAMAVRRRHSPKLTTLMAVNLGNTVLDGRVAAKIARVFNAVVVPLAWREIETGEGRRDWAKVDRQMEVAARHGLRCVSGPLLPLDAGGIPDWTYLWEGDFDNLLSFMMEHVRAVVTRYRGKVQLWQVAARVNVGEILSLTEEQRLKIVVRAAEMVRQIDPRTPMVVGFDQPWGEYLARRRHDLSPMHFADILVRGELGLAGLAPEINAGYHPGGTMWHSLLDYSRLLDRWSQLGLPLLISLTTPSAGGQDPRARVKTQPINGRPAEGLTPASQCDWIERYVPLILSKNCVQVFVWNQWSDADPHDFPHGGLIDASGRAKPALEALSAIRKEYLS